MDLPVRQIEIRTSASYTRELKFSQVAKRWNLLWGGESGLRLILRGSHVEQIPGSSLQQLVRLPQGDWGRRPGDPTASPGLHRPGEEPSGAERWEAETC